MARSVFNSIPIRSRGRASFTFTEPWLPEPPIRFPDSTFPHSQQVLAEQTAHMTPEMRDAIVWRNCAQLYGIEVG